MTIEDQNTPAAPDTTPTDTQGAPAAAEASSQPEAPQVDAFTAGVEAARAQEAQEDALPPAADPADGTDPAAPPADGQPPVDPAAPPAGAPTAPPADAPPAKPPTVDEEVQQLGLKDRAAERFRELNQRLEEASGYRERVSQWEQTVESTGASPEQFGGALRYLSDINSGDPARMGEAYDRMQGELQWLGKQLGREAPGFDPIAAHADLATRVASGDITRDVALELVQHRQAGALQQTHVQTQQQRVQQDQEYDEGIASVKELGIGLRANDPLFDQKMPLLTPAIEVIQQSLPPSQWKQAIHNAYLRLPAGAVAAPAAAAPPRAPNNPTRPAGGAPLAPKVTPENAFELGVQQARLRGQ